MSVIGRLAADPEVKQSSNGQSLVEYSIGSGYGPKDNRQVSWYKVTSFAAEDTPARALVTSLTKGLVFVSCRALTNSNTVLSSFSKQMRE